jgi:S1-C subfamily serine protease
MSRLSSSRKPAGFSKGGNLTASFKGVAVALILSASSNRVWAQEQPASPVSPEVKELKEVKEVFDRAKKAVVKIHGIDEHSEIFGTGFFVDPTGTLYTSYTVGGEAGNFTIDFGGKEYPARQVLVDVRSGMAILKIDAVTPALPIGKSEQLEVATPVIAIGYPLDLRETPSFGMIAGFDRKYLGRYFSTTHLRVNVAAQRGEAGAPLLNFKGEVVGILVSSLENNSSCYALPIDAAEKIRSDFVRFGEARHGWVGANVSEAKEATEGSRAQVTDILDTPAADAGIKSGDILLQVGRTKVREPEDVLDASFFITAGDNVPITVMRGSEKLTFNVQADFHPASKQLPRIASPLTPNRVIPLNLQSAPQRTP